MLEISLEKQVALVTGADRGIGRAIALDLASAGADIVINHLPDNSAEEVLAEIRGMGRRALSFGADVSEEEQVEEMFAKVVEEFGSLDILVNNAGIQMDSPFLEMSLEQWQGVLNVNLTGAFLCAREAAREFCRHGVIAERSKAAGKIIFISSVHQAIPWAGHANYAAAKGGMNLLMQTLAQELAPHKIRVNSIGPGAVKTEINREAWQTEGAARKLCELIPYGRIGETKDIGQIAAWLASDAADYITGTTIFADGGMLLYPGFRTGG
jgi:glucose 1-dehydrogenase